MRAFFIALAATFMIPMGSTLHAQSLTFRRDLPPVRWGGCAANDALQAVVATAAPAVRTLAVSDSSVVHAAQLAAEATEAEVLGNSAVALQLLTRAATLNPLSATVAYRRARALEAIGNTEAAVLEYCRYLDLPDADDRASVEQQLVELTRTDASAVAAPAVHAFIAGLGHADTGQISEAERDFTSVIDGAPQWSNAWYNRALTRIAAGNRDGAADDLRRYMALQHDAPDSAHIHDLIATLDAPVRSPSGTLAAGIIMPGLGHFMSGRPAVGVTVLLGAGGAIAAGLLIERTDVACLGVPQNGQCPPDQVLRSDVERPYLLPAIGVAAAIGIGGAIEAWRHVRGRNARDSALLRIGGAEGAMLEMPQVRVGVDGADVAVLRLRF